MRVFEAISAGTEVICPRTSYLTKLFGDSAHYYEPSDTTQMLEQIVAAYRGIAAGKKLLSPSFIEDFNTKLSLESRLVQLNRELSATTLKKEERNPTTYSLRWFSRFIRRLERFA
jgi:hypothetical protein